MHDLSSKAIEACRSAGVSVKMITGDHPSSARAIGEQVKLLDAKDPEEAVVSGTEVQHFRPRLS